MSALSDKLLKNSTLKHTAILSESVLFNEKERVPLDNKALSIALSGSITDGLIPGFTMFAGPSKHFKSLLGLMCAKAYLEHYDDSVVLFYDNEGGTPDTYMAKHGINPDRVVHSPVTNIEEFKFDITKQLEKIERGDRVMIVVDSIGNMASKKEIDDALDEKAAADFTRAKQLKSAFRIVVPHLWMKNLPMIGINHTYQTMEMHSKTVVGGGTGSYYGADNIIIIGRRQSKTGTEVDGYDFILNVEKSRFVREKSKIPLSVRFDTGIDKWSGIGDLAVDAGYIKRSGSWYEVIDPNTGEVLSDKVQGLDKLLNDELYDTLINNVDFQAYIEDRFKLK